MVKIYEKIFKLIYDLARYMQLILVNNDWGVRNDRFRNVSKTEKSS